MKKTLINEIIAVAVVAIGMSLAPTASGAILEDFENYNTLNGVVEIDPSAVDGSGWSAVADSSPDWAVRGDNSSFDDLPYDGSDQALFLRRSNANPPGGSDQDYNFALTSFTEGTFSVQVNPSSTGDGPGGFNMELRDSVAGSALLSIRHGEKGHTGDNGTGDWIVYDASSTVIADGNGIEGTGSGIPSTYPHAWDRWYEVRITLSGSTYDVDIHDLGPTLPSGVSHAMAAMGSIVSVTGQAITGVTQIDQFRLSSPSHNGGSNQTDPTMIDNIALTVVSVPGGGGPPIVDDAIASSNIVVEATAGIGFQSEVGVEFRLQSTPDLVSSNYTDTGVYVIGNGGGMVLFDPTGTSSAKNYRVMKE